MKNDRYIDIVADDRERSGGVIDLLADIEQVTVRIRRLSIGDYRIENRLLFERKTLKDFVVSIIDGRLFSQMIKMTMSRDNGILILEGTAKDLAGIGIRREALQGALITTSIILGIPVLRSMDVAETARLMVYTARQVKSVAKGGLPRYGYQPKGKRNRQAHILQGLPGIGRQRALKLLDYFGSIEAIINANEDSLKAVDCIGEKVAKKIKWAVSEPLHPYESGQNLFDVL